MPDRGRQYSFHITFDDGSNPYWHFPVDKDEHKKALKKWSRGYRLSLIHTTENSITGTITELYEATRRRGELE